jgi:hypothetical protein
MGTQVLGSQAGGNSVQFYFNSASNTALKAINNPATAPGDIYIDFIACFAGTSTGGGSLATCALYGTGGTLIMTTPNLTIGAVGWSGQGMTPTFLAGGANVVGAILGTNQGIRTWGKADGGTFSVDTTGGSFPSPWTSGVGSVVSGLGNMGWYATYFPASTISSLSKFWGNAGDTITVNGQSFSAGVNSIDINGTAVSSWHVNSDTQLTFVVPSGFSAGTLSIHTNAGTATTGTFYPGATASVGTNHAPEGATITVNGLSFSTGVGSVTIGSIACGSLNVINDTTLTCTVPVNVSGGQGNLVVNSNAGSPSAGTFYIDPTISSFTPTSGGPGSTVTIIGTGFLGVSAVDFYNGVGTTYTINSDTQITTTVPVTAQAGPITLVGPAVSVQSAQFNASGGWIKIGGVIMPIKGMWYKTGGVIFPVKGAWFKTGGTISPIK